MNPSFLGFLFSETKNLQLKTDNSPACLGHAFLSLPLPVVFLLLANGYRLLANGCRLLPHFPLDIFPEFPPNYG
jgi:hypothetical protein